MATDRKLHRANSDGPEVWAPIHAWRTLAQLRAAEATVPLLNLLHQYEEDDWVQEEIPVVMGMIGQPAIAPLQEYLANHRRRLYPRIGAAQSLSEVAQRHTQHRSECVQALTDQLRKFEQNNRTFSAFLISYLVDLDADEAAEVMEAAFAADKVDFSIRGDWEDAQIELGLIPQRTTPPMDNLWDEIPPAQPGLSHAARKKNREKAKYKKNSAKNSRKKNKRKR